MSQAERLETARPGPGRRQRAIAYAVHLYTAAGLLFVLLAVVELFESDPDPVSVFIWLAAAMLLDATDGPLARRFHVEAFAPEISGRTLDDIIDYLSYTFVPLLLMWRMGWLPFSAEYSWLWLVPAMAASAFGFANIGAKQESGGFFLGFPSYWNIYAFYAGIMHYYFGAVPPAVFLLAFSVLTLLPVRFLYPNLAPQPWCSVLLIGAAVWFLILAFSLPAYPAVSGWLVWLSLVYPLGYTALSFYLDLKSRKAES